MKKILRATLVAFVSSLIGFIAIFFLSSLEETAWNAIVSLIPNLLFWLLFFIIVSLAIILPVTFLIKKISKKNPDSINYIAIFLSVVAILIGGQIAEKVASSYFPNPIMKVNEMKVIGNTSQSDVEEIKNKFKRKNILEIKAYQEFYQESCQENNTQAFQFSVYGAFPGKCTEGDIMVITGHVGHGGSGTSYLIRKVNNKWEIIDEKDWGYLG